MKWQQALEHSIIKITSPIGDISITSEGDYVISLECLATNFRKKISSISMQGNCSPSVQKNIIEQLQAYFEVPSAKINIPFKLSGTSFQKKVWHALKKTELGTSLTYLQLAQKLDTSARAIGQACRKNPIPLIIPCHRVVSSQGLGGFMGGHSAKYLQIKKQLLHHEAEKLNLTYTQ